MWRQAVQCGSRAPTRPEPSIGHIVEKNDVDHGAGSQAIPEVVCKKGISIEGWKFPSPGGVSALVHGLAKRADEMNWFRGMPAERKTMFSLYSLEGQGNIFNDLEFMRGALFERKHWLLSKLTFWPLQ
ncbi:hypothetical protein L2E82_08999 [Cichorium intybus]|uniref:Uncharacterized protein n=1 Tax=Cichorium intybus TaxID=13427 RepID=A0ACB9G985_CICIN|nr:hypothetical protein L2E82_08999 [Cichorium intybus]